MAQLLDFLLFLAVNISFPQLPCVLAFSFSQGFMKMEIVISVVISVILSVITSVIAVKKDLAVIKEERLRDRYWDYIEALISSKVKPSQLERQTYNICLFAKNKQISDMAKSLLKQSNVKKEKIEELISLMRKDLGL